MTSLNDDVVASDELLTTGLPVDLCYQTFGSEQDPAVLLVMGLGGPMIWWDAEFCSQLAATGLYVIRYDNRDIGRSQRFTKAMNPQADPLARSTLVKAFMGRRVNPAYTLAELAEDGFALLDFLGIERAHVVGMSMGGMIAQTMALTHPERVRSLTSIMSTTGRRSVGWQDPRLLPRMLRRTAATEELYVESSVAFWRLIESPGYRADLDHLRDRARDTFRRGLNPAGVVRQMVAILSQPDRTAALGQLRIPTVVIHGMADRLVHVSGGRATAAAIPGARLVLIPGMGHDLPAPLFGEFITAIRSVAAKA